MEVEPPADMREMALIHFQVFRACVDAGFTEDQALQLMIGVIARGQMP